MNNKIVLATQEGGPQLFYFNPLWVSNRASGHKVTTGFAPQCLTRSSNYRISADPPERLLSHPQAAGNCPPLIGCG